MNASIARTLTGADVDTVRQALAEAIEGVQSTMDGMLHSDASLDTVADAAARRKWTERICIYGPLLDMLGGPIDNDQTSFQEIAVLQ